MTALQAIRKRTWAGSIPVCVYLDKQECLNYDEADPYIVNVPRLAYFPSLLKRLYAAFRHLFVNPESQASDGWFSIDGKPVHWNYPVGLLFDLYVASNELSPSVKDLNPQSERRATFPNKHPHLPWRVTVHFQSHPSDVIIPIDPDFAAFRSAFRDSAKQSRHIRSPVSDLSSVINSERSQKLMDAADSGDITQALATFEPLLLPDPLAKVPIRIFLPLVDDEQEAEGGKQQPPNTLPVAFPFRVVQAAASPPKEEPDKAAHYRETTSLTIGAVLAERLPSLFGRPEGEEGDGVHAAVAILHGVPIPLSARVVDLNKYSSYADGWINIVIAPPPR